MRLPVRESESGPLAVAAGSDLVPMAPHLQSVLSAAADGPSLCAEIRGSFAPYAKVITIDLLPIPGRHSGRNAIVCIVEVETAAQAQAARRDLDVASFGARSLSLVVERPLFELAMPLRWDRSAR